MSVGGGEVWKDSPQLPPLTICAEEMNLGQQQQQRSSSSGGNVNTPLRSLQSGRNISRKSRFSTQDLFGLPNGNAKWLGWDEGVVGGGGNCCKLCGRFRFGFGIDFARFWPRTLSQIAAKFHLNLALYDSCTQFSIESAEFAWRESGIYESE